MRKASENQYKTLFRPLLLTKEIGSAGEIEGHGSTFDNVDWYGHVVVKGAFDRMLEEHANNGTWPFMYADHDQRKEIGEWSDIRVDEKGLYVKGKLWINNQEINGVVLPPDNDAVKKYRSIIKKKGRPGLSIGWRPYEGGVEFNKENDVLLLKSIYVGEISPVMFPANTEATITQVKSIRDLEALLRDVGGLSRNEAKRIAAHGFEKQRDAEYSEELKELIIDLSKTLRS